MDATRRRFGSLVEWLVAAVCAAGTAALLSRAVQELVTVRTVIPVIAEEAPQVTPVSGLPAGVVRVPLLLLGDNRRVSVGQTLSAVSEHLGAAAQLVSESIEDTPAGRRITRAYNDVGVHFILVSDASRGDGMPRVSAIFVR